MSHRLICKLLTENQTLVKYKRFTESKRIVGNPVSTVMILRDQVLDEFFICDLGYADPAFVRTMTDELFSPVTVAGGIKTMAHVDALIREAGADKVVVKDLALAESVAEKYGRQAVVWAFDYCGDAPFFDVSDCVGEIMLTSVDRDGTGTGYDVDALRFDYRVPVVIAGGCGRLSHVKDAFAAGADAACVSSMFAFTDKSPIKLRSWLLSEGCDVRAV